MTDPVGAKQTRLAPDEETGLQEAPSGLFIQGQKRKLEEQTRLAPDEETTLREAPCGLLMQGDPGTQKSVSLRLDDRSEVVRFCRQFVSLRAVFFVLACFPHWAEWLTRRPWVKTNNRRHPKNPRMGLSQCFPSALMCSETTVISVGQKRVPKICRGTDMLCLISCIDDLLKRVPAMFLCRKGPFFGSGSTRETKMSFEKQSETRSLVLITLGCVQTCFRVPFTGSWIGRPGSPIRKAPTNVRECPSLGRRLLKCARRCHRSFWYQEGFLESHIGYLLTLL
ncbi:hypothetical protein CRG98_010656 [Punica granatum]|uniref:Uncharacterized protein n=1 Tax=Punica granatum TaxID=22663 RepID=A0A2I0KMD3_PUNGR|nr:hypothetical protein CRG98_010656 [Punica granatum]